MPLYEHVFMARQDVTPQQVETMIDQYRGVIEQNGGTIAKTEQWGVKSLAYRIKKNRKAHFTLFNLDAPPAALTEMERQMRISEDVLRFMTVRVDEHEEGPSAMMQQARPRRARRPRRGRDRAATAVRSAATATTAATASDRRRRDGDGDEVADGRGVRPWSSVQHRGGGRRPFFRRRKTCPFSGTNAPKIDYKDVKLLQRYVSERGKIVPSPHHGGLDQEAARARPGDQAGPFPRPADLRDQIERDVLTVAGERSKRGPAAYVRRWLGRL